MEAGDVETLKDFVIWGLDFSKAIRAANQKTPPPDWAYQIELQLRSFWQLVLENRDNQPTWNMFARMLHDARTHSPGDFNTAWIRRREQPFFTKDDDEFEFLSDTIAYQIGELRHAQILLLAGDAKSRTHMSSFVFYDWKNPGLGHYLSQAFSYFDGIKDKDSTPCAWEAMAIFFLVGQRYE